MSDVILVAILAKRASHARRKAHAVVEQSRLKSRLANKRGFVLLALSYSLPLHHSIEQTRTIAHASDCDT